MKPTRRQRAIRRRNAAARLVGLLCAPVALFLTVIEGLKS